MKAGNLDLLHLHRLLDVKTFALLLALQKIHNAYGFILTLLLLPLRPYRISVSEGNLGLQRRSALDVVFHVALRHLRDSFEPWKSAALAALDSIALLTISGLLQSREHDQTGENVPPSTRRTNFELVVVQLP